MELKILNLSLHFIKITNYSCNSQINAPTAIMEVIQDISGI
jgi:hypothetical protein